MMAVTAFWTSETSCWESMFSGCPAGDRGMDVSSWVFLCHAMISSRRTAFKIPSTYEREGTRSADLFLSRRLKFHHKIYLHFIFNYIKLKFCIKLYSHDVYMKLKPAGLSFVGSVFKLSVWEREQRNVLKTSVYIKSLPISNIHIKQSC